MPDGGPDTRAWMRAIAQERDRRAYAELYGHFAPRVRSWLLAGGCEGSEADNLVHDIFITVWQRADTYDPSRSSVSTWLFTVARNRRIDRIRRERRPIWEESDPSFVPDPRPRADQDVERSQSDRRLRGLLDNLPREQAEILRRAYFDDQTLLTIAEESAIPLGTVKSRVRLAFQHLRRALGTDSP